MCILLVTNKCSQFWTDWTSQEQEAGLNFVKYGKFLVNSSENIINQSGVTLVNFNLDRLKKSVGVSTQNTK